MEFSLICCITLDVFFNHIKLTTPKIIIMRNLILFLLFSQMCISLHAQRGFYLDFGLGYSHIDVDYPENRLFISMGPDGQVMEDDKFLKAKINNSPSVYFGIGKEFISKKDSFFIFHTQMSLLTNRIKGSQSTTSMRVPPVDFSYQLFYVTLNGGVKYRIFKGFYVGVGAEFGYMLNPSGKIIFPKETFDRPIVETTLMGTVGYSFNKFRLGLVYNSFFLPFGEQHLTRKSYRIENPMIEGEPEYSLYRKTMHLSLAYFF